MLGTTTKKNEQESLNSGALEMLECCSRTGVVLPLQKNNIQIDLWSIMRLPFLRIKVRELVSREDTALFPSLRPMAVSGKPQNSQNPRSSHQGLSRQDEHGGSGFPKEAPT